VNSCYVIYVSYENLKNCAILNSRAASPLVRSIGYWHACAYRVASSQTRKTAFPVKVTTRTGESLLGIAAVKGPRRVSGEWP
jgi:hypothetical protein